MNKNPIRDFCEMHMIRVLDRNKLAYKSTRSNAKFFQYPNDYNLIENETIQFETEPLYTVEIAESELQRMAEFELQVFNHMKAKGHYDMFNMIMEQKEKEKQLRLSYPAVQKAYENYSLMLKLAEAGEL